MIIFLVHIFESSLLLHIWLLLTNVDHALEVFLKEIPSNMGYKAYAISLSFALFLLIIYHK